MMRSMPTPAARSGSACVLDPGAAEAGGLFARLQSELPLPFQTQVLGVDVDVVALELDAVDRVMVHCRRGDSHLRIPLQDLPMPSPPPPGHNWITAWCRWHDGVELTGDRG